MHFRMNRISLHYCDPEDGDFVFFNTLTDRKESYSKLHIKCDELENELYASLGFP